MRVRGLTSAATRHRIFLCALLVFGAGLDVRVARSAPPPAVPTRVDTGVMPAGIIDPLVALREPIYSDPVFWWRMTSRPPRCRA